MSISSVHVARCWFSTEDTWELSNFSVAGAIPDHGHIVRATCLGGPQVAWDPRTTITCSPPPPLHKKSKPPLLALLLTPPATTTWAVWAITWASLLLLPCRQQTIPSPCREQPYWVPFHCTALSQGLWLPSQQQEQWEEWQLGGSWL